MTAAGGTPDLDRIVAEWLRAEAPARAPARVLTSALDRVEGVRQERRPLGPLWPLRWTMPRLSMRTRLVALAGLLVIALLGAALVVGGFVLKPPAVPPVVYEAIFLRYLPLGDGTSNIEVIAVGRDGVERLVTTLPPLTFDDPEFPDYPSGTVSPGGRLALHVTTASTDPPDSHWAIVDLSAVDTAPLQVFPEIWAEPVAGWGPDEQFAAWVPDADPAREFSEPGIAFVDARAGSTDLVEMPQQVHPYYIEGLVWSSDGVVVGASQGDWNTVDGEVIPDLGFVEGINSSVLDDGHGGRRFRWDGARFELLPPPMTLYEADAPPLEQMLVLPGGGRQPVTGVGDAPQVADLAWAADRQAIWTITWQREGDQRRFNLGRVTPPAPIETSLEFTGIVRAEAAPGTSFRPAQFAGLAPDDSLMVLNVAGHDGLVLAVPGSGETFEVPNSFAGWLATDWNRGLNGSAPR